LLPSSNLLQAERFDEDGSFIGQYGSLQRQQKKQQKIMAGMVNNILITPVNHHNKPPPEPPNLHFESESEPPASSNYQFLHSKSAAGGTYV